MVDSQAQSAVVNHVYQQYKMSERRVCELIQIPRSTYRYEKVEDKDKEIRGKLRKIAYERKAFGYRRLHILLQRKGCKINHKKTYRLYKEERLNLRIKSKN